MGIRLLHTADLQLGKGFGQFPPDVAAALRSERMETLKRIAVLAQTLTVDAVLVAGDCFDDIAVADETLRRFRVALEPFDGTWVLLPGNHDPAIAESPWSRLRRLSLPANVIIADRPEPIVLSNKVAVLPAPLCRRRDAADLTDWFDAAVTEEGLVRIGLAHGSVRDFLPEASEAANPIAIDRADRARLDYLALGDWHGRLQISERTWYSGTPEPDRFRANEPGYVLDVTIEAAGVMPSVEAIRVGTYRWIQRSLEIVPGGTEEIRAGLDVPEGELERCVVQLDLRGTIDLATRMAVSEKLDDLGARVMHLEENDVGLVVEPTDDDLDAIDVTGFVRVAMNRLREKLHGSDATTARRALALLYGLHHRSAG
ncbi:MAG: DNA repair exonuclease [Beijerinckiaceae bacterium]|nr:DNA repair exonuclease [Beijerinckiaceae bacterium]